MRSAKRLARRKSHEGPKAWMHRWLLPPALWEAARRFARRGLADEALSPPEHPAPLSDMMFSRGLWSQSGLEPHWIPVEKMVNYFGQSFTTEHNHYVRYLETGFDDFVAFYRSHQPETALQAHFIGETLPGPAGANMFDFPWQPAPLAETDTPIRDPESFGPASDLELATEAARLDRVLHSVKKYGFLERYGGDWRGRITGRVFVHDNGDFRVGIICGKHRAAVLAHLGWNLIPVRHQVGFHPVRLSDLAQWPGVVDGRFAPETARAMFEALFRPAHQQLLPGW